MELRAYLQILTRKWWIVLPTFIITVVSTAWFTFNQAWIYQAKATFIVTPDTSIGDARSVVSSLDILSRRSELSATYAQIADSRRIKQLAADQLGLSSKQRQGLSVQTRVLPGSNVLEIAVNGSNPMIVTDLANAIGTQTIIYVHGLHEVYRLEPLDQATLPRSPIKPDRGLNLILGALCGFALGVGLAFLSDYLQTPQENVAYSGVLDNETGVYNKPYFMQRLGAEVSRAKRNKHPLSLVLINVDHLGMLNSYSSQARSEALREVAGFLKQNLREEDVVARFGQTVFAFLLPDMPGEMAKETMERLQTTIPLTSLGSGRSNGKLHLTSCAGVTAAYQYSNGVESDELLMKAMRALEEAETANYERVCLLY